jgi:hypothetical protein
MKKEALCSFETSVLTRSTWRNNPEVAILHSHRREDLKSYKEWETSTVRKPVLSIGPAGYYIDKTRQDTTVVRPVPAVSLKRPVS